MKKLKSILKNIRSVYAGFKILNAKKQTPPFAYQAMRDLFVQTNGRSNDIISRLLRKKGYENINFSGVLQLGSASELKNVVEDIRANGYHVFKNKLPAETVEALVDYARKTPCTYRKISEDPTNFSIKFSEEVLFDELNPLSPMYQLPNQKIVNNPELQKLIFDQSLLAVAQEYLQTKPVIDLLAMWWSVPFAGKGKSEAAQMYHFDLDRIKFIKFFFYLTDVDPSTGPHCYVKGSHKKLPPSLRKEGRMTDKEVENAFGKENQLELCGERGTIMAVDTRGLHKGKDLVTGKRLLFQIEFANSMFGQYYPPGKKPQLPEPLEKLYDKYSYTYKEIMS